MAETKKMIDIDLAVNVITDDIELFDIYADEVKESLKGMADIMKNMPVNALENVKNTMHGLKESALQAASNIKSMAKVSLGNVGNGINKIYGALSQGKESSRGFVTALKGIGKVNVIGLATGFQKVQSVVGGRLPGLIKGLGDKTTGFKTKLKSMPQTGINKLKQNISALAGKLGGLAGKIGKGLWTSGIKGAMALGGAVAAAGTGIFKLATNSEGMQGTMETWKNNVSAIGNSIGTAFQPAVAGIMNIANGYAEEIGAVFADGFQISDMVSINNIITDIIDTLIKGIEKYAPMAVGIIQSISGLLIKALVKIASELLPVVLPAFLELFSVLLNTIINTIGSNANQLADMAIQVMSMLVNTFFTLMPQIIILGVQILIALVNGLSEQLPMLIGVAIDGINTLLSGLLMQIPLLMNAAMTLIMSLCNGMLNNLPMIVQMAVVLITNLVNGLVAMLPQIINMGIALIISLFQGVLDNLPMIVQAAVQIIVTLAVGLIKAIPLLINAVPRLIKAIFNTIMETDWIGLGKNILKSIVQGFKNGKDSIDTGDIATVDGIGGELSTDVSGISMPEVTTDMSGFSMPEVTTDMGEFNIPDVTKSMDMDYTNMGNELGSNFAAGFDSSTLAVGQSCSNMNAGINGSMQGANIAVTETAVSMQDTIDNTDMYKSGSDMMDKLTDGILSRKTALIEAVSGIVNELNGLFNSILGGYTVGEKNTKSGVFSGIQAKADGVKSIIYSIGNGMYTPENTATAESRVSNVENNSYNSTVNINVKGLADDKRAFERSVKRLSEEGVQNCFASLMRTNPKLREV